MGGTAVGGAEACVKPSRAKASSYAGLQAAVGSSFAIHSTPELKRSEKTEYVKCLKRMKAYFLNYENQV